MSPNSSASGSVRSDAEEWNMQIRKFWQRVGPRLPTAAEQGEYERLLAGWAAARGDVVKAA